MRPITLLLTAAALCAQPFPENLYQSLQWRLIGPFRGGRSLAVTGVAGDLNTFYFGSVNGGVWKTTNAGLTWKPIFDRQKISSIGAIAVAPSDPNTIYAGSGEADMRSDIGFGDGVYRSTDAGTTWRHVGLRDSRQIGRILVDPSDARTVYVAALGHAYGPSQERGVYRSNDGGATWKKILDKGPDIGAIDLAMDPASSRTLYAATWRARRTPWSQYPPLNGSGGIFKSTDAGESWTELRGNGLPAGEWGRVGLAAARGNRVYALVDAGKDTGLYHSADSGRSWEQVSRDARIESRAWYFSGITVDPSNADIVYLPNVALYRSTDGGHIFTVLRGAPGGDDYHSLWVDQVRPARMILGTDQGVSISTDSGASWSSWYNQPTAQLYHVTTDNQTPYNVYGSQQDSGSAAVPSRTNHGGITAEDRQTVGGGESGWIAVDPKDSNIVYAGDTNGTLVRWDKRTAQAHNITPWTAGGFGQEIFKRKYRFPWTAPLVFSPVEPGALYYGAQFLLKTIDGGLTWREVSPDLTGAVKGAAPTASEKERGFGVIYSIAPSPLRAATIWVGSDSGLIHVTQDGGKAWSNVTPPGLSDWSKITHLEASHFDPATAYAAVDRHRIEDYRPHLYRTRDFGKTWTEVVSGIEERSFVNAIREDPRRKGLLFAATELGVYVSFDDADHWRPLQLNLPVTSVRDLVIHGDDLVAATHGRSFWILDDMAPLREIDNALAAADAHLFKPAPAFRYASAEFQGTPLPVETPMGKNPPDGALIDFYFKSPPPGEVTLEITDIAGKMVRRYSTVDSPPARRPPMAIADVWFDDPPRLRANAGMNRFVWDLRYAPPGSEGGEPDDLGRPIRGPLVAPGVYQVRLLTGGKKLTRPLTVSLDPHSSASPLDLTRQLDLGLKISREIDRAADAYRKVAGQGESPDRIAFLGALRTFYGTLTGLLNVTQSADRTPPSQALRLFEETRRDLEGHLSRMSTLR